MIRLRISLNRSERFSSKGAKGKLLNSNSRIAEILQNIAASSNDKTCRHVSDLLQQGAIEDVKMNLGKMVEKSHTLTKNVIKWFITFDQ